MSAPLPTNVRWLAGKGVCPYCDKRPTAVTLMSQRNEEIGRACVPCGERAMRLFKFSDGRGTYP